jgi:hypothetical protein
LEFLAETFNKTGNKIPTGNDNWPDVSRTICEVAAAPESGNGIFGDFFNLLLTPQEDLGPMLYNFLRP